MNQLTVVESDGVIVSMKRASMALAEAVTISQTKKIVDVAAAAEIYAKRQHLSEEAEQMAATVKVEALRKLGEMLAAAPKNEGARGVGKGGVPNRHPTLDQLGLTKKESAVAQKIAALPEKSFQQVRDGHVTMSKAIAAVDATKKPAAAPAAVFAQPASPPAFDAADYGPSLEELADSEQGLADELAALRRIADADDKLGEANAMLKQRDALIQQLQWRVNGLVNENTELIREVKKWRRIAERAAA